MAKVIITVSLKNQVYKTFKEESWEIKDLLYSVGRDLHKGKALGHVGKVVIKEIKYKKWRFYFITDGHVLKFGTEDELVLLLIKFVRMSGKKDQQKVINEVKKILKSFGFE